MLSLMQLHAEGVCINGCGFCELYRWSRDEAATFWVHLFVCQEPALRHV